MTAPGKDFAGVSAAAPPRGVLLSVQGVKIDLRKRRVLDGADLTVPKGTAVCLCGVNGAGKTTLLRVIAGILIPREGSVRLLDLDPAKQRRAYARRIGFVPPGNAGLEHRLSVKQNLELGAALSFVEPKRRRAAVFDVLEDLDILDLAERRVDRLSLGQRQRIRLGLGLIHDPDLLLLDEPHSSLDDQGLHELADAMRAVTDRGGSVIWAAPSPEQAPVLPADLVAEVVDGKVQMR